MSLFWCVQSLTLAGLFRRSNQISESQVLANKRTLTEKFQTCRITLNLNLSTSTQSLFPAFFGELLKLSSSIRRLGHLSRSWRRCSVISSISFFFTLSCYSCLQSSVTSISCLTLRNITDYLNHAWLFLMQVLETMTSTCTIRLREKNSFKSLETSTL